MERLIRLLRIINIIQESPGIKARELADLCETSERNIYRDLEILNATNIPIMNEGHSKGYKFLGRFKQYPLNWDEDELQAFEVLPVLLGEKYKTKAFMSAYEKVMATHKVEQVERKTFLSNISKAIQSGKSAESLEEKDLLPFIIEAVLSSRSIEAIYHTQSRNTTTTRKIDPYFLMPRKDRLYIIGYDHKSSEIRTFRLNRFQSIKVVNEKFTKDDISLEKYLQNTWSIIRGEKRIDFKVKFSQEIARYIKEEEYNLPPKLTELTDGSLLFEVTVNDDREILKWIMQYGPDAEILEPESYRLKMKEMLQKWNNFYQ
ncbi:Predicted DNA-binding transcriptional regulator YafY, contains an HTH and WYL domains [Mesobacillus persicus]|uniref:Predicted DNA-binding transcriptional regulator YafY, contains an HTH and WYL domains n=1 Tax=Mesobacillus persicus TaxID=930146 RepID=A0A1H8AVA2_9BACI|nr:WYL domain-containing transcriptional regulator [Mesobacillus persicus]SEM73719.1 Predicted DNA-binding transcriptional regulator YafY, contains an HTH and WYL domains [Mesobacillus persicus]